MGTRYSEAFERKYKKIRDLAFLERIEKLIKKIIENPFLGKPMRYERKGTREAYMGSHRIAYSHLGDEITFLDFYHKDEQ